ncbi:hypothetical protein C6N67_06235 [Weissella cibaria]|nr:hypothetical protein C6N67_06235 [Weissella cibaria]
MVPIYLSACPFCPRSEAKILNRQDFFGAATSLKRLLIQQDLRSTPANPHTSSQDNIFLFDKHPWMTLIFNK